MEKLPNTRTSREVLHYGGVPDNNDDDDDADDDDDKSNKTRLPWKNLFKTKA